VCGVAVKCPCIGVRAIVSLPIRTPWSVDTKAFSASTLFSASFFVSDSAIPLPLAGMSSWCVVVMVGFTYSPVNPLFLLASLGVIVSSKRVVGCLCSSSDPPFLYRFPRFSIKVSTCCLEEDPGVGLWGPLLLFRFLWLCHTSSVNPVWVWRMCLFFNCRERCRVVDTSFQIVSLGGGRCD
jgi:hypothetical protein